MLTMRSSLGLVFLISLCLATCSADFDEAKLLENYSGVQNWFKFSRRYDISRECSSNEPLRVAYFTRHAGTMWDFIAVADHLNVSWTNVHPGLIFDLTPMKKDSYEIDREFAHAKWRALGQMYCHIADILQVGDIIADARPMLQGNCTTPIILQVTNRFDIGVRDHPVYYEFMAEAVKRPNVWVIANNPYDKWHLEHRGVKVPNDRFWLLRPVGVSMLPRPAPETFAERAPKIAFIHHAGKLHLEDTYILPWIYKENLTEYVHEHGMNYGGPAVLAQHRGAIQVPYQASVMKMYEGMAAGTAFILPSDKFFSRLVRDFTGEQMAFCCRDVVVHHHPDDWQPYIDWYHPDFAPGLVYYDSWDELKSIIKGEGIYTEQFFTDKKTTAKAIMERMRRTTFEGYDQVYDAARRYACATNGQPDAWSEGMGMHAVGGKA